MTKKTTIQIVRGMPQQTRLRQPPIPYDDAQTCDDQGPFAQRSLFATDLANQRELRPQEIRGDAYDSPPTIPTMLHTLAQSQGRRARPNR